MTYGKVISRYFSGVKSGRVISIHTSKFAKQTIVEVAYLAKVVGREASGTCFLNTMLPFEPETSIRNMS